MLRLSPSDDKSRPSTASVAHLEIHDGKYWLLLEFEFHPPPGADLPRHVRRPHHYAATQTDARDAW